MNIMDISRGDRSFLATWADGSSSELPYIWLRDNDPDELHPHTRERIFDLTSVELDICPRGFELGRDALTVTWPERGEASVYRMGWLDRHRPGQCREDKAAVTRRSWDHATLGDIPRADSAACAREPALLAAALSEAKCTGIIIFTGLPDEPGAGEAFGDLVGFKRETNFGVMFEVVSKPEPNNLAYTSMALPLHTDLPNQDVVPGFQFLHSYRNKASGGESVFADGLRICEELRAAQPEYYQLLCKTTLPWRFHDQEFDIRRRRPVINLDAEGELDSFVFNAHIADVPDLDAADLYDYYAAYRDLMQRVRDDRYCVRYALQPGEMVAFDNKRVLHGRTAFDPESGNRHFRGFYIEQNEIDSRIRVLSRATGNTTEQIAENN